VVCGALLGLMLLTRPLDGVIAGSALVAGVALLRRPVRASDAVRGAAWLTLGFVPWLVLALLFNLRTTGSLTEFPLMASDPRNTFGFGERGMQVGTSGIHYDLHEARMALQTNLQAGIGWVFGGVVAIALAVVALTAKPRLAKLWLLGLFALPPAAYFFWWATSLSADGAMNGIGPHYYVMSLVPVAVLAADGFTRIARRHLALGVAVAVLAVGATAWNLPDKIDTARFPTDVYEPLHETLDVALDDAVVFVASDDVERFTNLRYPFLRNPPGLDGPVLYAADRHAENALLIDGSRRTGYLAHREISPGDDIFSAHWVLTPLSLSQGPEVHLRPVVTLPDDGDATTYRFFVEDGDRRVRSTPISAEESTVDVVLTALAPGDHDIRIGLEDTDTGEKWMRLYRTWVDEDGTVRVIRPGTGEHVVDLGKGPVTVDEDVTNVVADGGG
jgi:hypothetical protein